MKTTKECIDNLVGEYIKNQYRNCGRILNEHAARKELLASATMRFFDPETTDLMVPRDGAGLAMRIPVCFDSYGFEPEMYGGPWRVHINDQFGNPIITIDLDNRPPPAAVMD